MVRSVADIAVLKLEDKEIEGSRSALLRQIALPDHQSGPAEPLEGVPYLSITLNVSREFLLPEVPPGGWHRCLWAVLMTMPKAAVHEQRHLVFGKREVRAAREIGSMKSISEPCCMQRSTNDQLRFRVLPTNGSHHARASCGIDNVQDFSLKDLVCGVDHPIMSANGSERQVISVAIQGH